MGFVEILLLFLCFCLISASINIIEKYVSAKLMKVQIKQSVDTFFSSVLRAMVKYKLDAKTMLKKGEKENV